MATEETTTQDPQDPNAALLSSYRFLFKSTPDRWTPRQVELFIRVLTGLGDSDCPEIARQLNRLGLTTRRGQQWKSHHVYHISREVLRFTKNEEVLAQFRNRRDEIFGLLPQEAPLQIEMKLKEAPVGDKEETFDTPRKLLNTKPVPVSQTPDEKLVDAIEEVMKIPPELRRTVLLQMVRGMRAGS